MSKEIITYAQAREAGCKQGYLDGLLRLCPESVQALVYDPDWAHRNAHMESLAAENYLDKDEVEKVKPMMEDAYFIVTFPPSLVGVKRKHPIFVSDGGFNKMKTEQHFLSSLLDHEAYHTDDLMYGIRLRNGVIIDYTNIDELTPKTVINIREVTAYRNQLQQIRNRELNDPYFIEWLKWQLRLHMDALSAINPNTELERIVLENP